MQTLRPAIDSEQNRMLDFARLWAPHGGGPSEDIMVRFGLTSTEFFTRLQSLLEHDEQTELLTPGTRALVLACCRRRLWVEA
ncbi:MAG: DUF3263 domain-containing protein [Rhodococcus sp. (in: high G+C Gram-positive bacteria)]|jgi:hypothetical protein|uniref:DUF3263 domain-containing protein n=1 Tax=Rhodococcus sp. EPR-157 TaxID=1813677 RepID=UPI0007BB9027|nr:DUF3263 domain-containing protein [Rhodococcus sp. EPR-157]KZF09413.1 hypothetical protein A2J03_02540 [Rhodococcus sp. EPR-157]